MTTRAKFLFLIDFCVTVLIALTFLFLHSSYAREEYAYFTGYPAWEMTARHTPQPLFPHMAAPLTPPPRQQMRSPARSWTDPRHTASRAMLYLAALREDYAETFTAPTPPVKGKVTRTPPTMAETAPAPPPDHPSPPRSKRTAAQLGYLAYAREDYDQAMTYFKLAIRDAPDNRHLILQSAYAAKKLGRNTEAIHGFRRAIELSSPQPAPFPLRREVEQLQNRFDVEGYWIYRDESNARPQNIGADLTQSLTGIEVSYQPPGIGYRNGRRFQVYGRLLAGMVQDSLRLNDKSYQAGLGLRYKPLARHNLVLSAERLIKVGDFARHDWMLRVGYSRDHGTDYREDISRWLSYSLYFDAALIRPADPDMFLTAQADGGYNMRLGPGLVLRPRLLALATWQKDRYRTASLIEAGPGASLRFYFNDTPYQAYRSYVTLTAEYRIKIAGNSIGGSGPVIGIGAHF
ncbi:NfrA family protein [Paremcibacter congregatus]|uniref:NfrA family protein n=1 Tax=Paremcibacter congregatus TaxID=2043170 RepID=UPI0030EEF9CA